jgi:hypothetical protein
MHSDRTKGISLAKKHVAELGPAAGSKPEVSRTFAVCPVMLKERT